MKAEYTQGNIAKKLLATAGAMLACTLAMTGYNMADTFFAGRLGGENPLAAMGYTFPVVMLVGCLFQGFGSGCMTTMAQAIGRQNIDEASRIVSVCLQMIIVFSQFIAIVGICFSTYIFRMLGAEGETLGLVNSYMNIWFAGCVTCSLSVENNKILIAAGRPKVSSAMTVVGMLINVFLDPLMMFGGEACLHHVENIVPSAFHFIVLPVMKLFSFIGPMGLSGAALATVISQFITAFVMVYILFKIKLLKFQSVPIPEFLKTAKLILTYGIPAMLGMLLFPIGNSITTWATASFGNTMVAGVAAASRLESVAFVLPMSFGIPLMPFIAQNYGAKLYSRIRFCFKFAISVAFIFLTFAAVILFFGSEYIVPSFTKEIAVQQVMIRYMTIIPFGFCMIEITRFSGFALVGCGHPVKDTVLKCVRVLGIMIPMYLLTWAIHWQDGIFVSRLITDVLGGIICLSFACSMIHKLPKQDGEDDPAWKAVSRE